MDHNSYGLNLHYTGLNSQYSLPPGHTNYPTPYTIKRSNPEAVALMPEFWLQHQQAFDVPDQQRQVSH
jgi:hypothetical protein